MLIVGGSGSGKTNALLNLIKEQSSDNPADKIYLYAKVLNEPKYQVLIKKTWRCRNKKWFKCIYRIFTMYGWYLQQY